MKYPIVDYVATSKEMVTNFQGYDESLSALEGSFTDEINMTSDHYPILSTRDRMTIAEGDAYTLKTSGTPYNEQNQKTTSDGTNLVSMRASTRIGAATRYYDTYLVYGTDRYTLNAYTSTNLPIATAYYNTNNLEFKRMGSYLFTTREGVDTNTDSPKLITVEGAEKGKIQLVDIIFASTSTEIMPCDAFGNALTNIHEESYYDSNEPKNGDYMRVVKSDGSYSIKVYSGYSKSWSTVTSTYVSFHITNPLGEEHRFIKEGDAIKIDVPMCKSSSSGYVDYDDTTKNTLKNLFPTRDEKLEKESKIKGHSFNNLWRTGTEIYSNNFVIKKVSTSDSYNTLTIVVQGLYPFSETQKWFTLTSGVVFSRVSPEMKFVVECQNRLWGCSADGHEIYCCKLGDPMNWNYFSGTAIDSYVATVGSSGTFTGAIVYNQNPIFFKENSMIKVSVSQSGAHSYREVECEGIEKYSYRSLKNVDNVLYYLGKGGVYAFDGSSPVKISDALGKHRYTSGISGTINGKYYLSVVDTHDDPNPDLFNINDTHNRASSDQCLFVYDTYKGIWIKQSDNEFKIHNIYSRPETLYIERVYPFSEKVRLQTYMVGKPSYVEEDDTSATDDFFSGSKTLYYTEVEPNSRGRKYTQESLFNWYVESPPIGYGIANNKYVGKLNIRLMLEVGSYLDFWMKYDNEDHWRHVFNMSGKGTRSFTIPVTPRRCDTFRYKLSGKGDCKIISITKTIEEGSDV